MLSVVKSYLRVKLGERGAEMVEYAIVLACIAAVGVAFYSSSGTGSNSLKGVLDSLWGNISTNAATAGTPAAPPAGK